MCPTPHSEYWRAQCRPLQKHLSGVSLKGPVDAVLDQALHQPLRQHLQQCVLLLLRLRDALGEVGAGHLWKKGGGRGPALGAGRDPNGLPHHSQSHSARELVTHAITLYGSLQSFLQQALDQAVATQGLRHSLNGRLKVSLGPAGWAGQRTGLWGARAACCVLPASVSPLVPDPDSC